MLELVQSVLRQRSSLSQSFCVTFFQATRNVGQAQGFAKVSLSPQKSKKTLLYRRASGLIL